MESKHNVLARDARGQQFVGHWTGRPVMLHPYLAVLDVNVDDTAVHASDTVPTNVHDFVVIVLAVYDRFGLNPPVGGLVPGILLHQSAHDLAVPL
jgi:hypothetical protein